MSYTNGLDDPTLYFNTKLYTGNGSTQSITGVGFQPDWTWIKERNGSSGHVLIDSVRGVDKVIRSNQDGAESTDDDCITSFDTDGYSLGDDIKTNESASFTYVGWSWLAGGTASSNTDGSITSTVSANTTSGFSIVSYTGNGTAGATVGHGLSSVPEFILVKGRSVASTNWKAQHVSTGTNVGVLNANNAFASDSTTFNNTLPTSSVFTIGTESSTNTNSGTYIAYCFHSVKGFSKFGSYTGNGSTDGTFIYTGFKPAFVITKCSSNAENWDMFDNKRNTFNVVDKILKPSASNGESTFTTMDFVSNGFKHRNSDAEFNLSGRTYIYMAFAENPFVTSTGIPTTAR